MSGLLSLMSSRKAWITLFGIAVSVLGIEMGITSDQIYVVAGLCALLVMSIAGEDAASKLSRIKVDLDESKSEEDAAKVAAEKLSQDLQPKE